MVWYGIFNYNLPWKSTKTVGKYAKQPWILWELIQANPVPAFSKHTEVPLSPKLIRCCHRPFPTAQMLLRWSWLENRCSLSSLIGLYFMKLKGLFCFIHGEIFCLFFLLLLLLWWWWWWRSFGSSNNSTQPKQRQETPSRTQRIFLGITTASLRQLRAGSVWSSGWSLGVHHGFKSWPSAKSMVLFWESRLVGG